MKFASPTDAFHLTAIVLSKILPYLVPKRIEGMMLRSLADLHYHLARSRRNTVSERLLVALGNDISETEIARLTIGAFRSRWTETFAFSSARRSAEIRKVEIEGLNHLNDALELGRGVILWESDFGQRLMAKAVLSQRGFGLCQVHYFTHGGSATWLGQSLIKRAFRREELRYLDEIVDIQGDSLAYLRILINRLKENSIVAVAATGTIGSRFEEADFLDSRIFIATGIINLARTTGARIIPIFYYKTDNDIECLRLESPIQFPDDADQRSDTRRYVEAYAKILENYIRTYPDQWTAWHKKPTFTSHELGSYPL